MFIQLRNKFVLPSILLLPALGQLGCSNDAVGVAGDGSETGLDGGGMPTGETNASADEAGDEGNSNGQDSENADDSDSKSSDEGEGNGDSDPSAGPSDDGSPGEGEDEEGQSQGDEQGSADEEGEGEDEGKDEGAEEDTETSGASDETDTGESDTGESDTGGTETGEGESSSESSSESGEPDPELIAIVLAPYEQVIEVDLNTPTSVPYTVTGFYDDGSSADVAALVDWSTSNPPYGAMNGSNLDIPGIGVAGVELNEIVAKLDGKQSEAFATVAAYDQEKDFFFSLPHNDAGGSQEKPLSFATDVQSMDVFFNMDTTGSMGDEINNLKSGLNNIINTIRDDVPDTRFGVGRFDDFPSSPHGNWPGQNPNCDHRNVADQPFTLLQTITDPGGPLTNAVNGLYHRCGGDVPEAMMESLYQIATGEGVNQPGPHTNVPSNNSGVGGVGFREGTVPIIVSVTDAVSHAPGEGGSCNYSAGWPFPTNYSDAYAYNGSVTPHAHTRAQTKTALDAICARSMTLASLQWSEGHSCSPINDGNDFATATGTRIHPDAWDPGGRPAGCAAGQCCTGQNGAGIAPDGDGLCPMVFRVGANGSGVSSAIINGIKMIAQYTPFSVSVEIIGKGTSEDGVPLPAGKTTADFIKSVTPDSAGDPPLAGLPDPTINGGGFDNVTPGTDVFFNVEAYNDFIAPTSEPQLFTAQIRVIAGNCAVTLDTREVLILVPPKSQ